MSNFITDLEINNFKSIKHIKMDCKRINVLIGRPNVGKSNILEALSLYNAPYGNPNKKMLEDYIRYERLNNLFYDQDKKNLITIKTNQGFILLKQSLQNNIYEIVSAPDNRVLDILGQENEVYLQNNPDAFFKEFCETKENQFTSSFFGRIFDTEKLNTIYLNAPSYSPIKKYHFKSLSEHKNHFSLFLNPPYGDNLFTIIEENRTLWGEVAGFFNQYGLDLLVDKVDEKLEIQKQIERYVIKTPYSLVSDTLQRIIFHLAAIETNNDSVLLFEEPESHSYPPYVSMLAERIVKNKQNQYFITTHSPYLLAPFIEQCPQGEVAIFIAKYENYETKIKALSDAEIDNIMETGIDLFYNIHAFSE